MVNRQRQLGEERQQLDLEVEENQSERNQKYRELRKREETMDTFLGSYTATREEELQRLASLETQVRTWLFDCNQVLTAFLRLPPCWRPWQAASSRRATSPAARPTPP